MNAQDKALRYCGIVFIGGGSSWFYAPTVEQAAQKAANQAKADWKTLYKFKRKQELTVEVYDTLGHSGWYAAGGGVKSLTTKKPLPFVKSVQVTV